MEPGTLPAALVWALLPGAALLSAIWWLDRYEKESLRLLGIALGLGAVGAPLVAVAIEWALDLPTSMAAQTIVPESELGVGTPIVEEVVRGLAVLAAVLFVRDELDGLLDGLVYGAVVGLGFGVTANFVSILEAPSLDGGAAASLFVGMVTGTNHVFYGGLVGVAAAIGRRRPAGIVAGAAAGTAAAALFHVVHDYLPWWIATSADEAGGGAIGDLVGDLPNALGLAALATLAVWTLGREKLILSNELGDEVRAGVVAPSDYADLTRPLRRPQTLTSVLLSRGARAWRLQRRLYGLEAELAFRKHRRRTGVADPRRRLEEDDYRAQIRELRAQLEGAAR